MNPDDVPDGVLAQEFMCYGVPEPVIRALGMDDPDEEMPAVVSVNAAAEMRVSPWWYGGYRGEVTRDGWTRYADAIDGEIG